MPSSGERAASTDEAGGRSRGLPHRTREHNRGYNPQIVFLVVGMLLTGTCNTLLNKLQDMVCVEHCDDPDPSKHKYFEQPIYQTLNMFVGELMCLFAVYVGMAMTGFRVWRSTAAITGTGLPIAGNLLRRNSASSSSSSSSSSSEDNSQHGSTSSHPHRARPSKLLHKAADKLGKLTSDLENMSVRAKEKLLRKENRLKDRTDAIKDAVDDLSEMAADAIRSEIDLRRTHRKPLTGWHRLVFWLPTLCDICGTTLMNVGLIYTTASIYQMLRGAVVIFSGIFSIIFLRHRMMPFQWFALTVVVAGVGLVGVSSIIPSPFDSGAGDVPRVLLSDVEIDPEAVARSILGVSMVLLAQVFTAGQFVIEEKIMLRYAVDPLLAVGYEGLFGCVTVLTAMPLLHFTLGQAYPGGFFDMVAGWHDVMDNRGVWTVAIGIMFSISFFNWFGLSVTRTVSSVARATIDTCRTLFIWMVSLSLGWEHFKWLQVIGFAMLVYGTFLYNGVVEPPKVLRRADDLPIHPEETEPILPRE